MRLKHATSRTKTTVIYGPANTVAEPFSCQTTLTLTHQFRSSSFYMAPTPPQSLIFGWVAAVEIFVRWPVA
jgi:hypothetical protein